MGGLPLFLSMLEGNTELLSNDTLYPMNGNSVGFPLKVTDKDGNPMPGVKVDCSSTPHTLTGSDWRTIDGVAGRFSKRSGDKIRNRIKSGTVRLGARVTPSSAKTDSKGEVHFKVEAWHVCGNSTLASDKVTATLANGGKVSHVYSCGVTGLVPFVDNSSGGLTTSGLVGRHVVPSIKTYLEGLGRDWKGVKKDKGIPNYLVITGATMKWGG